MINQKIVVFAYFIFLNLTSTFAQNPKVLFIEENPEYTAHESNYILDKITYTEQYMILKLTYICDRRNTGFYFCGAANSAKWFLEDTETGTQYNFIEIRNIRKGDKLQKARIIRRDFFVGGLSAGKKVSCEVYFERLSREVKEVDLIQEDASKSDRFHCFDIELKQFKKKVQEAEAEY